MNPISRRTMIGALGSIAALGSQIRDAEAQQPRLYVPPYASEPARGVAHELLIGLRRARTPSE